MGLLDTVANFVPGFRTLEGIGKGIGKVFQGDFKGAISAVGKGLSNDWGLGIAAFFIPGGQAIGMAQLGAVGLDMFGAFGKEGEGQARQPEAMQYAGQQYAGNNGYPIQGPNIGW
jgi:hypothetical protein